MTDESELVRRARELVPMLQDRAQRTEELRMIPPETIDELHAAGLMRAAQPGRFGGFGLDICAVSSVAAELGRGCGSTAWCYAIWSDHNCLVGMFPERAQEEYWAESRDTLGSTGFNPARAHLAAVSGGYRLSGQWDFSSGCDAASWVLVAGRGPEGPLLLMVPKSDYLIEDTWFVSGLRGSGSKDIRIDDVFVPEYRALRMADMGAAQTPGRWIHDNINYRVSFWSTFPFNLASTILGMAQGAIEVFETRTAERISAASGEAMANSAGMQAQLGEAAAEVWAARAVMQRDNQEIFERARRDEAPSQDDRIRYRRDQAYVTRLCLRAVDRLFEASGAHALYDSSALQRFHRDAHAASHHAALSWANVAEQYGRVRLGLEPTIPWY